MKQWLFKVFTLTVTGMVVYLIFSKDDSLYYRQACLKGEYHEHH